MSVEAMDYIPDEGEVLLDVRDLRAEYQVRLRNTRGSHRVSAVAGVSFHVESGTSLGIVGETGCGKSTLARTLLMAVKPSGGQVFYRGENLTELPRSQLHERLKRMQMVFQDPFSSLDPKWTVVDILREPMTNRRRSKDDELDRRVSELLDLVGMDPSRYWHRHPGELSGGECQRIAIARSLALSPELLICDEAVSSLDVSIQAQILNLFVQLRNTLGLSYIFIAHDLTVVRHVSDRIAVMHLGKFCEIGSADQLYRSPRHPYTEALISAIPHTDPSKLRRRVKVTSEPPSPVHPPSGCRYRTRCPRAQDKCALEDPVMTADEVGHFYACHFPLDPVVS